MTAIEINKIRQNVRRCKHQLGGILKYYAGGPTETFYQSEALNTSDSPEFQVNNFPSNYLNYYNPIVGNRKEEGPEDNWDFLGLQTEQAISNPTGRKYKQIYNLSVGQNDLAKELQELKNIFKEEGLNVRFTSEFRPGAKTKSGHQSFHALGQAMDIVPVDGNFKALTEAIRSNDRIVRFMQEYGLGIYDETTPEVMKRTGATGPHFHVGPDKVAQAFWNYSSTPTSRNNQRLRLVVSGGSHKATLYDGNKVLFEAPVTVGLNGVGKHVKGNKTTPEGKFTIIQEQDSSKWTHDYEDGKGPVLAYGPTFFRLSYGNGKPGIGIHGTNRPEKLGQNDSNGCIRFSNENLAILKQYMSNYGGFRNVDVEITRN